MKQHPIHECKWCHLKYLEEQRKIRPNFWSFPHKPLEDKLDCENRDQFKDK